MACNWNDVFEGTVWHVNAVELTPDSWIKWILACSCDVLNANPAFQPSRISSMVPVSTRFEEQWPWIIAKAVEYQRF